MRILIFTILVAVFFTSCGNDVDLTDEVAKEEVLQIGHTYSKTEGPDKNPLKGWNSGWWNDLDHASVGFQYLKWKDFEPINGTFDFDVVEELLARPGTNGRHFILRLYCDWFGEEPTSDGGPAWLYDEIGVARLQNNNGKYLTDFNDVKYTKEAVEAIEALVAHYDKDPRVYTFQIGVLGYWGEWHTFSFDDYQININAENEVLNAYKNSISNAHVMGRYPWREPLASTGGLGFTMISLDQYLIAMSLMKRYLWNKNGLKAQSEVKSLQI